MNTGSVHSGAILEPAMLAAVELDQIAHSLTLGTGLVEGPALAPRQPKTGIGHPLAQRFPR